VKDIIKETVEMIESVDKEIMDKTQKRLDKLTKPLGSLGKLEELAKRIAGITKKENPVIENKVIFTMAGDHGVVEEGISAYPQEVTPQMVQNFLNGGAGINVLARHVGAKVIIVDMGIKIDTEYKMPDAGCQSDDSERTSYADSSEMSDQKIGFVNKKINHGTKNFTKGPAMTREEAEKAIIAGIEIFESENKKKKIDIIGTGDMGIGNTTPSSAITAVFTGKKAEAVTGTGTGIDVNTLKHKVEVIEQGIKKNNPDPKNGIDVLSKVGGFEIGGLAGVILASAKAKTPVVIDGFISGAAALIAYAIQPKVKDYLIASHCSVEKGHKAILDYIGIEPLFDFNMRLGEGTGAALGINIADASIKILKEMATFDSAGVSEKK